MEGKGTLWNKMTRGREKKCMGIGMLTISSTQLETGQGLTLPMTKRTVKHRSKLCLLKSSTVLIVKFYFRKATTTQNLFHYNIKMTDIRVGQILLLLYSFLKV